MSKEKKTDKGGADLHIHTSFSDGSLKPDEVVKNAADFGLEAISITDHDTIAGIHEAVELGLHYNIEVIPGIELTCTSGTVNIHILGYFIDYSDPLLLEILDKVKNTRIARMKGIIEKLNELGVKLDPERFFEELDTDVIGRLHLAIFLVKERVVGSIYEAFERYIGDGKPAYLKVNAFDLDKGINLITGNGGIAVYAHPGKTKRDDLIPELVRLGIRGIEVYTTGHSLEQTRYYLEMAEREGLLVCGGSDCHGYKKRDKQIGKVRLPMERVDLLKKEKNEGEGKGKNFIL